MLESIIAPECPCCKATGPLTHGLCADCRSELIGWDPDSRCQVCSFPIAGIGTICQRCLEAGDRFDRAFFLFPYRNGCRTWIHHLKFRDRPGWLDLLNDIEDQWVPFLKKMDIDAVSWIPAAPLTRWHRGYNLSHRLARLTSGKLGIPVVRMLRPRRLWKRPLSGSRDLADRKRIIRRFIAPVGRAPRYDHVLLVDDVFTTGTTLNRAADILKRNRLAETVTAFTIARVL